MSKTTLDILIPTSYADVTVRQYKKMLEGWDENDEPREAALVAVSALCDVERSLLDHANWDDVNKIIDT